MATVQQPNKAGNAKRKTRAASKPGKPGKARSSPGATGETSRDPQADFNENEWQDMVSSAAYFRAESRGFAGGSADEDWYEAEALLREQLAQAEDEADEKSASDFDVDAYGSEHSRED